VRVAEALESEGRVVVWLPVPSTGRIAPTSVEAALLGLPPGFVVALMAANHETGVLQPVVEVAAAVRAAGGRLHVDAAQAAGKVEASAWLAGDTLSLAAHKLRGPKGIGALVLRSPGLPKPVLLGGAQERGVRPGTLDAVGAAGFDVAARRSLDGPRRYAALAVLRDRIERRLAGVASVNGVDVPRLPHVSNLSFEGWKGDELVAALDLEGVRVSSGSACSAGSTEPSPIIRAMLGEARASAAVRISLGDATDEETVEHAIESILRVVTARTSRARDFP
jgi:cysteine desulfurase